VTLNAWVVAMRPATLPAALAPVAVGSACAHAATGIAIGPAIAAALGALLLQIASNFANDVFDYEKGADRTNRLGPTRAVQAGLITPSQMKRGLVAVLAAAFVLGIYLFAVGGWPIVLLGLAAMAAAVAYTGGPFPLGYHGLGDLLVLGFFGFAAVCGTTFVQVGEVTALSLGAALPVGALATAILVVNNLRDRAGDAAAGKRTLAVRLGARGARGEYAVLVAGPLAIAAAWAAAARAPFLTLPLLTLPWAARLIRAISVRDGAALNPCLPATARLLLAYSLLWALGIALSFH
jgi:1,4-dihydroxy-2-naphthoate octaprenyltransferase